MFISVLLMKKRSRLDHKIELQIDNLVNPLFKVNKPRLQNETTKRIMQIANETTANETIANEKNCK